ncbi:hypothetical protein C8J57DRAFT_1524464 [Mycena rebaudengoi]|nr:hypothetical protein C8J57DRAFT_1524464 [Mycena rebaudengoi]
MSSPTRLFSLLRYSEFAASAAKSIADVSAVPFLAAAASISLAILKTIERAKTTKEQHVRILENIHHLLCSIIQVHSASGTLALHSPALSYEIGKITNTLQKIYTLLDTPKMGKIKQILKLGATSVRLAACDEELQHSVQVLKIQTNISSAAEMGVMKRNSEQHHERLVAVLSATDSSNSVVLSSSDQTQTLSSFSNSSASLSLIPGSPKVFYGREGEVKHVTDMLLHESAPRIAILGTGGMGKTSLSLAVLHGSEIAAKYPQRIFVSCHSSTSYPSLVSNIASYVGLETGPNLAKKLVRHFTEGGSALLVLDNFETPWELPSSRSAVEDFLSVLAGITHLAIVVTMRGAERPSKIKWTRPFLPALEPLSDDAAFQIFADVADDDHDEASVKKLMALTGNLPLTVQLVANVASYEGCASTLLRWSRENTGTISEGHCKTSNLDISIMLSLSSSRMTPDALALLSVLSMLPNGLSDSELSNMELPIPNLHASKATLIRVSLAYKGGDGRLRVLVPIREYLRSAQPPTSVLKVALRKHFHGLMDLWDNFYQLPVREVVSQIVFNLGNLESVLSDGLNVECPDALTTIHSILCIQRFYVQTGRGTSPLILRLSEKINNWRDHFIYGDYLMQMVSLHASEPGETEGIIGLGRSHFEHADDLRKAQWNKHLAQYYWKQENDIGKALEYSKLGLSLATSTGDWDNTSTLGLLNQTSSLMSVVGNYTGAREYAQKAQLAAELSGNLPAQATALCTQANCSVGSDQAPFSSKA